MMMTDEEQQKLTDAITLMRTIHERESYRMRETRATTNIQGFKQYVQVERCQRELVELMKMVAR